MARDPGFVPHPFTGIAGDQTELVRIFLGSGSRGQRSARHPSISKAKKLDT